MSESFGTAIPVRPSADEIQIGERLEESAGAGNLGRHDELHAEQVASQRDEHIPFKQRPLREPYAPEDRGDRGERRGQERGSRIREEDINESWPEPPEWAAPGELDKEIMRDLRGLSKEGAEFVAIHMVAATGLADEDPELAWRHARAARSKGGRIAVVRETVGLVAYRAGEWAEAISELRAARRMGGGPGHVAILADCERAQGNPEKAIDLARSPEAEKLDAEGAAELRIVVAGARADLGQLDAALAHLRQGSGFELDKPESYSARLYYAYADLLLEAERADEALEWFIRANDNDSEEETDAEDRIAELLELRAEGDEVTAQATATADPTDGKSLTAEPVSASMATVATDDESAVSVADLESSEPALPEGDETVMPQQPVGGESVEESGLFGVPLFSDVEAGAKTATQHDSDEDKESQ